MSNTTEIVRDSFAEQSKLCAKFGSPFTSMLVDVIGRNIDETTSTGRKVLEWNGTPNASGDAVALRMAGALHALSTSGLSADLASVYPPKAQVTPDELWPAVQKVLTEFDDWLLPWLDYAPQTNEVGRSGVLFPGLLEVQQLTGLPIALFEIGASAGLNLILDRFSYDFLGVSLGEPGSGVKIHPDWTGPVPADVPLRIDSRIGCDRAPIDLTDTIERERLLAYVWPDQVERYTRIQAAIGLFGQMSPAPVVEKADAAEWVKRVITPDLAPGRATVLMHSLTFCYLLDESKQAITEHMNRIGAGATSDRPLAWLAYEFGEDSQIEVTLRIWPGGEKTKLADADAHGRTVNWLAETRT